MSDRFDVSRVRSGEQLQVDVSAIERSLSEFWNAESSESETALTRAALWNVIAHTTTDGERDAASDVLSLASATVPQRTIVIRSAPHAETELRSWISANCHLVSGSKQVCSEEISIVAGGDRVQHVPSLVNALLMADMPVATWWLGDLPPNQDDYVQTLLQPSDRFIIDSVSFDNVDDLRLVRKIGGGTDTVPADLNWVRLEDWRVAAASVFDPPCMRERLHTIHAVRITSTTAGATYFGEMTAAYLVASWLVRQLGHSVRPDAVVDSEGREVRYEFRQHETNDQAGEVVRIEIEFDDGGRAIVEKRDRRAIRTEFERIRQTPATATRITSRNLPELIARQLSYRDDDRLLPDLLPIAISIAERESR